MGCRNGFEAVVLTEICSKDVGLSKRLQEEEKSNGGVDGTSPSLESCH